MARTFNGTSDVIKPSINMTLTGIGTSSAWVRPSNTTVGDGAVFGLISGGHSLTIFAESPGHFAYYDQGGGFTGSATYTINTWYHVAHVVDGVGAKGYVNGVADGSLAGLTTLNATTVYWIGYNNQNNFFPGDIADMAVWNTNLTPAEVLALAKGARPNMLRQGNLIRWWPIDGVQSPEPDLSGNAANGVITGTTSAFGPPYMQFTPRWPRFMPLPPPPAFILMPQIVT